MLEIDPTHSYIDVAFSCDVALIAQISSVASDIERTLFGASISCQCGVSFLTLGRDGISLARKLALILLIAAGCQSGG